MRNTESRSEARKRRNNIFVNQRRSKQRISQHHINDEQDFDVVDIIKHQWGLSDINNSSPVMNIDDSIVTLKSLLDVMTQEAPVVDKKETLNINATDPTLDFRFLHRKSKQNIFLPPIKTRLNWQNGEFPFFKTDIRYYNHSKLNCMEKRRIKRGIKATSMQSVANQKYIDMAYPEDIWPCKAVLYVSNLRLFVKRNSKESFYIPFENIANYQFYNNALVVEYFLCAEKIMDVFFVESEQARLLETIIKITL